MALLLTHGFLAGEVFPPCHRYIDVGRLDLEREDAPPLLLKCRQGPSCRPLPLTVRRRALRPALRHRTGRNGPDSIQRNTRSALTRQAELRLVGGSRYALGTGIHPYENWARRLIPIAPRHGIRHAAARAGRRPRRCVANGRLRHMLIGDARVSKADGSSQQLFTDASAFTAVDGWLSAPLLPQQIQPFL